MRKTGLIATLLLMCAFIFSANAAETWVKVTDAPESWEGDYLIVSGDYAFDGSLDDVGLGGDNNARIVEDKDDIIIMEDCDYYFTIKKSEKEDEYLLISASGFYIGVTTGKYFTIRSVNDPQGPKDVHRLGFSMSGGDVDIENHGTCYFQFNSRTNRFYWEDKDKLNPIQLYKRFVSALAAPVITGVSNNGLYFGFVSISILTEDEDATVSYTVTKDGKIYDSGNGGAQFKLDFSEQGQYVVETFAERGDEKSEYQRVVFTVISAGLNEVWVKVTEESESWEGDYLIVSGDYAFDGSLDDVGLGGDNNARIVEDKDDIIIMEDCDYYFTIKKSEKEDEYLLISASGFYIGVTTGKYFTIRSVNDPQGPKDVHRLGFSMSGGDVDIENHGTCYFQFNSRTNRFYWADKDKLNPVQLYRRYEKPVESSATEVSGIAELKDAGAAAEAGTVFEMNCPLTVTFSNGDDLYVIDDSGDALLIKGSIGKTYASGEVIPAGAQGCYELIDGFTPAMVNPVGNTFGEPQATVEVTPISVDEITVSDVNKYVKVEDVMVDSTDSGSYVFMASDDGNEIPGWSDAENPYYNGTVSPGDGLSYDVSGIVVVKEGSAALAFTNLEKRIESGVDDLVTGNVMIAGGKCRVIINVPDGNVVRACVYSVSGILLNEEAVTGVSEIELPSGLYIVRIGNQVAKVVVR